MTKMKKLVSLLLAAMMLVGMMSVAVASEVIEPSQYTISITQSTDKHDFYAYQIFKGTYTDDGITGNAGLEGIAWGDGVNSAGLLSALNANDVFNNMEGGNPFASCSSAAEVANAMSGWENDGEAAREFAVIAQQHVTQGTALAPESDANGTVTYSALVDEGYYILIDSRENNDVTDAYSRYILAVNGNVTVQPKTSTPSVEKKVKENSKTEGTDQYGYSGFNDVADWAMGDEITFRLYGTMPATLDDYSHYYYKFVDEMDNCFDVTGTVNSVKVWTAGSKKGEDLTQIDSSAYDAYIDTTRIGGIGNDLIIEFDDIKGIEPTITAETVIIVEYTVKLNSYPDSAEIGLYGNENDVHIEYSNDPYWDGTGELTTSETPKDTAVVFTYELDGSKVDGVTGEKLAGAKFKLYRMNGDTKEYAVFECGNSAEYGYMGGEVVDWKADTSNLDDNRYTDTFDSGNAQDGNSEMVGNFRVIGLDDGTYYLEEVEAPVGYNILAKPIQIKIAADTEHGEEYIKGNAVDVLNSLKITVDFDTEDGVDGTELLGDESTGTVNISVANLSGAVLPSTGGIGTTIFYAVGGLLVVLAVVLLVTKRRVGEEN